MQPDQQQPRSITSSSKSIPATRIEIPDWDLSQESTNKLNHYRELAPEEIGREVKSLSVQVKLQENVANRLSLAHWNWPLMSTFDKALVSSAMILSAGVGCAIGFKSGGTLEALAFTAGMPLLLGGICYLGKIAMRGWNKGLAYEEFNRESAEIEAVSENLGLSLNEKRALYSGRSDEYLDAAHSAREELEELTNIVPERRQQAARELLRERMGNSSNRASR